MKRASKFITLLLIFAIMFVVGGSLVITYPDEYTIIRQFGEIVRVTDTARRFFKASSDPDQLHSAKVLTAL